MLLKVNVREHYLSVLTWLGGNFDETWGNDACEFVLQWYYFNICFVWVPPAHPNLSCYDLPGWILGSRKHCFNISLHIRHSLALITIQYLCWWRNIPLRQSQGFGDFVTNCARMAALNQQNSKHETYNRIIWNEQITLIKMLKNIILHQCTWPWKYIPKRGYSSLFI